MVRSHELYSRPPEELHYKGEFEPMVVELMVKLFTTSPVMGGPSMADQREHILAVLAEPLEKTEAEHKPGESERSRLIRQMQDPNTPMETRARLASKLRELNKRRKEVKQSNDDTTSS